VKPPPTARAGGCHTESPYLLTYLLVDAIHEKRRVGAIGPRSLHAVVNLLGQLTDRLIATAAWPPSAPYHNGLLVALLVLLVLALFVLLVVALTACGTVVGLVCFGRSAGGTVL
jgi:hypothetical protein